MLGSLIGGTNCLEICTTKGRSNCDVSNTCRLGQCYNHEKGNLGVLSLLHRQFVFIPYFELIDRGLAPWTFAAIAFQSLLNQAGFDPAISTAANPEPCGSGDCFLTFAGKDQSINSIALKANGILCALQSINLLLFGSFADYGRWRPWILIIWTLISWGAGFGWLGVHDPSKWQGGIALYILGGASLARVL